MTVTVRAPSDVHAGKCEPHRAAAESALSAALGTSVTIAITAGGTAPSGSSGAARTSAPTPPPANDDDIDLTELVDAPPEEQRSPEQDVADLFPGSRVMESED